MEYLRIGSVRKAHGLQGELRLNLDYDLGKLMPTVDVLYIGEPDRPLPYFIEQLRGQSDIFKLEGVDSPEAVSEIRGCDVFLPVEPYPELNEIVKDAESKYAYGNIVGFTVQDQDLGKVGKVLRVEELSRQTLATVLHEGREKLIPLNRDFVYAIDFTESIVHTRLPEGLLDL